VYLDDIIFGATNEMLYEDFTNLMQTEFKMSMMGELKFFLGMQIKKNTTRHLYSLDQVCERNIKNVQHE